MNVYDFDGTIYHGDSSYDFYFYLLLHYPKVIKFFPVFFAEFLKYQLKISTKTLMKETFYRYLTCFEKGKIHDIVTDFWKIYRKNIYKWYKDQYKPTDVIISASPRYLLAPICEEHGIKNLICSEVDPYTGEYTGINCYGEEKVRRFCEKFLIKDIDEFYSDSISDAPMARLAKKAFLVTRTGKRFEWPKSKL